MANAYEVLMDPEKKARFDNGEDLNEPPQQVPWLDCGACWPSWRFDPFCSNIPSMASVAAALPFTLDNAIDAACDGLCLHALNAILRAMAHWSQKISGAAQHQVRAAMYVLRTPLFACLTLQAASVCAPWMCSSWRAMSSGSARQPALSQNRCCRKLVQPV